MSSVPHIPSNAMQEGWLYNAAHFSTAYLNVPPNYHRLRNAVGLMLGLYLGRKTMDILAGETPTGEKVDKNDLPIGLKHLHGILHYDHFSDNPAHRWMKVFDLSVPALLGGVGACLGSASFFEKTLLKEVAAKSTSPASHFFMSDAEKRAMNIMREAGSIPSSGSAILGSASGTGLFPSFINYSSTLGTTFSAGAERTMANPLLRPLFNSHSHFPFRPTKLITNMIDYAAGNPSAHPKELENYARGIIKTWFKGANESHVKAFVELIEKERAQFLKEGRLPEASEAKVKEQLKGLLTETGLENTFIKLGLDPREAAIGDMGFMSSVTHLIGDAIGMRTSEQTIKTRALLQKGIEQRHPELLAKPFVPPPLNFSDDAFKKAATLGFMGAGAGVLGAVSLARDTSITDFASAKTDKQHLKELSEIRVGPKQHLLHSKRDYGLLNGKMLDTAEGVTGMFSGGVGVHRVYCALGLTAGSWLGDEVMKSLTGISFAGGKIKKDEIWQPLRGLYKKMPFNPHSDAPHDKWMQILRWGIPGIIGTLSVIEASKLFFQERHDKLKNPQSLDEVEARATEAQSQPWSYTAAISGLFGFPSGLPMLPLTNYSTNLGTRFSMASGRKVSMPLVGKIWSNNPTLFPFGPPGMIELLVREAVNNKAHDPELLETYAIGVLKPWFENVTPEQIAAFVGKVYEVRDQFYQEGGVPEELKAQLEKELRAHFKGLGLEDTLVEIGLDPTRATIGNNGLSGSISNLLGAKSVVDKLKADYVKGFAKRHEKSISPPPNGISA